MTLSVGIPEENTNYASVKDQPEEMHSYWKTIEHSIKSGLLPVFPPPPNSLGKPWRTIAYQPLPNTTSIRVLKLYAQKNPKNILEPIRCSMVVRDLADDPSFVALSYTWGDPLGVYASPDVPSLEEWHAPAFEIDCDGEPVSVATNLYSALVAIRSHFSGALDIEPRHELLHDAPELCIWIDALCINQEDLEERGQQVSLMDRIYACGRGTIMWLGGEDELISRAGPALRHLNLSAMPSWEQRNDFNILDPESYRRFGLTPLGPEVWVGLLSLFSRQYFSRAWITQEWVRSKKTTMLFGFNFAEPNILAWMLSHLHQLGIWDQVMRFVKIRPVGLVSHYDSARKEDKVIIYSRGKNGLPLLSIQCILSLKAHLGHLEPGYRQLLGFEGREAGEGHSALGGLGPKQNAFYTFQSFRGTKSSDPRDKVFAFLEIIKEFQIEQEGAITQKPDYRRSTREVYIDAAASMIQGPTGLSWLALKESEPLISDLPSWAPDLSTAYPSMSQGPVPFAASMGLGTCSPRICNGGVLRASGYKADTVVSVAKIGKLGQFYKLSGLLSHLPQQSHIKVPETSSQLRPWWQMFSRPVSSETRAQSEMQESIQDRFEVLWRTVLMNLWEYSYPADSSRKEALLQYLEGVTRYFLCSIIIHDVDEKWDGIGDDAPFDNLPCSCKVHSRSCAMALYLEMNTFLLQLSGQIPPESKIKVGSEEYDLKVGSGEWAEYEGLYQQHKASSSGDPLYMQKCLHIVTSISRDVERRTRDMEDNWSAKWYNGHYLFATSGGRLGMAGSSVTSGDQVWLLPGVDVPMVLRPAAKSGQHSVVGESYVHGMMHGDGSLSDVQLEPLELV